MQKITQHQSLKGEMRPQKTVSFVILEVFEKSLKILPEQKNYFIHFHDLYHSKI